MAKKAKSPGPLKKLANKITKNISKLAKPAAPAKGKNLKPVAKAAAKPLAKATPPAKSNSAHKSASVPAKDKAEKTKPAAKLKAEPVIHEEKKSAKTSDKKAPAPKKDKKAKKTDDFELDDGLVSDEELGSEEIPDLDDFNEDETAIEETDDSEVVDEEVLSVVSEVQTGDEEIVLTDAEGRRYCRVRDCDQIASVEAYCRYHYLLLWKRIQVRRKILADGKLARYVEELTSRYPDKFLEVIRKDLRTEKDFLAAIQEYEIDESADNDFESESDGFIEEVRGMSESANTISDEEEF